MPSHRWPSRAWRLGSLALAGLLTGALGCTSAWATAIPLGYISYDVTIPGSFAQFDITNGTGPNAAPPTFPVDGTTVQFTGLSLTVDFSDGSTSTYGPSYFTLAADGESLDGTAIAIGGAAPQPVSATLTGSLSTTTLVESGTPVTVDSSFDTAIITDSPVLAGGDLAVIYVETAGGTSVPEPDMTLTFLIGSLMTLFIVRRKRRHHAPPQLASPARLAGIAGVIAAIAALLLPGIASAATSVKQTIATTPDTGVAGVSYVNITGSNVPLPAGTILPANVTIKLAPTCTVGATTPVSGEIDAVADKVTGILGSTERFNFQLPGALAQETYYAQLVDNTNGFAGSNCSIVAVTKTSATLNACVPTSSLGVVLGTNVTAYVPNGRWGVTATGVVAVPIEGGGTNTTISTPNTVNSCAGNPATGQTVCTANNNDVYLISGSPPVLNTTLTSNLSGFASFSGGSCTNCGVAVNALNNTAAIQGGLSGSPSGDGVQILNLNTNTFSAPFGTHQAVSEDISIDPGRDLILSPNEGNNYMLLSTNSSGAITGELDHTFSSGGEPDSAAEDCSTGIALASVEFTNNVYAADLSQGTFTPGTPGSWSAPSTLFTLTGVPGFDAGISGISVAQGSSHLAIVAGEFGGNTFGVLQLQPASGTGDSNPTLTDYTGATMPPTPSGTFTAGCDPHTLTAYTSPNTGKAIGLYTSYNTVSCQDPSWIGMIDLAAALAAPRTPGTHTIDPSYDLIAHGVVTYIKVQ
jgi:hypothetical protein